TFAADLLHRLQHRLAGPRRIPGKDEGLRPNDEAVKLNWATAWRVHYTSARPEVDAIRWIGAIVRRVMDSGIPPRPNLLQRAIAAPVEIVISNPGANGLARRDEKT